MSAPNRPSVLRFDPFTGPPQIHGARRVGIRPGTELIHPLAATGVRPLHFEVHGLPTGITVDDEGILRGTAPVSAGDHDLGVRVTNAEGVAEATVTLCVGDTLALTPPMGWNSWNVYAKEVTAEVILRTAKAMVANGMRDLGYQYVNIDDHWHADARGADGTPRTNPTTFPDGIAPLSEALHEMGLKLGIYSDAAHLTCGKCFGGYGYERIDAQAYAEWGVDLLKYDYCYAPREQDAAIARYGTMSRALAESGRSIVFSVCEWGGRRPWKWAADLGAAYWRTTGDIFDSFSWAPFGVRSIARRNMKLAPYARPGAWNDPDMLLVGNRGTGLATGRFKLPWLPELRFGGISEVEAHTHMTLWSMMAAPLLASHDLTRSDDYDTALLTNPEVLAVDQDPLGQQGRRVEWRPGIWQLVKPLAGGGVAISFSNVGGFTRGVSAKVSDYTDSTNLRVIDAWTGEDLGKVDRVDARLAPHASAMFVARPAQ